ncbi:flagellar basal body-associated FliL family protein [Alphaproteobacteria bacterium]|jgi:flagellar FliL protein|nr:flagellar basal body-associated FliL family protein [Alphaproteobacteria bacterium]
MSDTDDLGDPGAGGKKGGKKIVLFVVVPLLLLIGVGAGVYFSGMLDAEPVKKVEAANADAVDETGGPGHYFEIDEVIVTLSGGPGQKQSFLKMRINLELQKASDQARIEQVMPRIIDNFQVFLRELRIEELQGSHGLYRVKEELLARVNAAAHPVKIKDVLFKEMLVQ